MNFQKITPSALLEIQAALGNDCVFTDTETLEKHGQDQSKNPIFLEAVDLTGDGKVDINKLQSVVSDYGKFIENHLFAVQEAVFQKETGMVSLKEGFDTLESWVKSYYEVK